MASIYEQAMYTVPGVRAGVDLSASQHHFVVPTAVALEVGLPLLNGPALGVLQNKPLAQQAATVAAAGSVSKVVASEAIPFGSLIATTATGEARIATGSGTHVLGTALIGASAAGELVGVLLIKQGLLP